MPKKRRYNSKQSITSDIKDFSTALIGVGILLSLWLIVIVISTIIAFWYLITPIIACLVYVWYKTRTIASSIPIPAVKTIETIEDIKTSQGMKKVKTIETYQEKQSIGIIQALINRL
jgi:hypothetical protein